jgi:hypothetical protein
MAKKDKAPATPKPKISQGMKIAGSTGGSVGKKELQALSKASDRSGAQLIQRLDKINANLKEKGKVGINLSSGAANMLIRQASKAAPTYDNFLGLGKSAFGTGKIGKTLQGMVGSRSTGGYINPISGQQSRSTAVGPTFLARGMDLMPGGRQTVRGVGKQFEYTPGNKGPYDGMMDTTGNDQGPPPPPSDGTGQIDTMLPEPPPEEEKAPQFGAGISEALANWATGFKTARSSRKRSGPRAQGLGSQRVNPTGAFRGGM